MMNMIGVFLTGVGIVSIGEGVLLYQTKKQLVKCERMLSTEKEKTNELLEAISQQSEENKDLEKELLSLKQDLEQLQTKYRLEQNEHRETRKTLYELKMPEEKKQSIISKLEFDLQFTKSLLADYMKKVSGLEAILTVNRNHPYRHVDVLDLLQTKDKQIDQLKSQIQSLKKQMNQKVTPQVPLDLVKFAMVQAHPDKPNGSQERFVRYNQIYKQLKTQN